MRHGDVEYFDGVGKPFRPDEVPLTEQGRTQAATAGEVLRDVPIDRAVASPLLRTLQTAEIVLAGRGASIERDERVREIAPGRLRDIPMDPESIRRAFVDAFGVSLKPDDRFLGGETFQSMLDRVHAWLDAFLADPGWRHALIVAHGGVNRAILTRALGTGLAGFGRIEQDPACINILDVDDQGRMLVRMINFAPTNPAKLGRRLTTMEELLCKYLGLDPDAATPA